MNGHPVGNYQSSKPMLSSTSLVLVFLLGKDQPRVGVLLALPSEEVEREGADLLEGGDGDVLLQAGSPPGLDQVKVDLGSIVMLRFICIFQICN